MAIIPQASGPALSSRVANAEARVAAAEATVAAAVAQVAAPNDSLITATGSTTARSLAQWMADIGAVAGLVADNAAAAAAGLAAADLYRTATGQLMIVY